MKTLSSTRADIVAFNIQNEPVLLVEVKTGLHESAAVQHQLSEYARRLFSAHNQTLYAMNVSPEDINIFTWAGQALSLPLLSLGTAGILSFYEPDFGRKPIFEAYLSSLVEAWLRDLAYHWKSEKPPAFSELDSIGLAKALQGGTTAREFALAS